MGVTGSCAGNFTGLTPIDLVLAKGSHLEIHSVTEEGLQPVYDAALFGRISTMKFVRLTVRGSGTVVFGQWVTRTHSPARVFSPGRAPRHTRSDDGTL